MYRATSTTKGTFYQKLSNIFYYFNYNINNNNNNLHKNTIIKYYN